MQSSVYWEDTVRRMEADGIDAILGIGPGKTLSGFMRKIDRTVKVLNIEKLDDVSKVVEELGC